MNLARSAEMLPFCKTPTRTADSTHSTDKSNASKQNVRHSKLSHDVLEDIPDVSKYFDIHRKVGEGTFSCVFMATCKVLSPRKKFAVKHLFPTSNPSRMLQELKCLRDIGGCDNVAGLELCFRNDNSVAFIMSYFPHDSFSDYIQDMTVEELKFYMKNLLVALRRVHSFNVVHRDVKPNNFLYNRKKRKFLLVDFGLSHSVKNHSNAFTCSKIGRKRTLDDMGRDCRKETKRPVLNSICTNVLENSLEKRSPSAASYLKKMSPLHKENSPFSKKVAAAPLQDIKRVKRNLQFGNLAAEDKKVAELASSSLFVLKTTPIAHSELKSLSKTDAGFFGQNLNVTSVSSSQLKSRLLSSNTNTVKHSFSGTKVHTSSFIGQCHCDCRPKICNVCLVRKPMNAPRAGTPGYRSPEVLLRYPHQTTAIDIWSAGVIMLQIMSASYPFFNAPDDVTALMEIMTVFGTERIKTVAKSLNRKILTNEYRCPLDLRKLCERLRRRRTKEDNHPLTAESNVCVLCLQTVYPDEGCLCSNTCDSGNDESYKFPPEAYDLLEKLLCVDPKCRYTAEQALEHPFLKNI